MEKTSWLLEVSKLIGAFVVGIITDKIIKRGTTKIINQNVCFYYPFAFQGKETQIAKIELHIQIANTSGNASIIHDLCLNMKIERKTFGFPFIGLLSPAITVKEKSSETSKMLLDSSFKLTQVFFVMNNPTFELQYRLNGKKCSLNFNNFSLVEEAFPSSNAELH